MIIIFSFLSILMIFVRFYSIISNFSFNKENHKFSERITVFILIFEIFIILLFIFFSSFGYLLPPALLFLNSRQFQYFVFENLSISLVIYIIINLFLLSTYYPLNKALKFLNRSLLMLIFLINIILGSLIFSL